MLFHDSSLFAKHQINKKRNICEQQQIKNCEKYEKSDNEVSTHIHTHKQ